MSGTFVSAARDSLMTIGNSHVVLRVCSQFGYCVKFTVDISNAEELMSSKNNIVLVKNE